MSKMKYRPLGKRCPKCRGKLFYEDHSDWVYIECLKCGHGWTKDEPYAKYLKETDERKQ